MLNKMLLIACFASRLHTEGCWNWQTSPPVSRVGIPIIFGTGQSPVYPILGFGT
jgi:hypothetical protein